MTPSERDEIAYYIGVVADTLSQDEQKVRRRLSDWSREATTEGEAGGVLRGSNEITKMVIRWNDAIYNMTKLIRCDKKAMTIGALCRDAIDGIQDGIINERDSKSILYQVKQLDSIAFYVTRNTHPPTNPTRKCEACGRSTLGKVTRCDPCRQLAKRNPQHDTNEGQFASWVQDRIRSGTLQRTGSPYGNSTHQDTRSQIEGGTA